MKLSILHIYNQKVQKRAEMRQFVLDHELFDLKKQKAQDRRLSKEEKQIHKRGKKLLQITSMDDYEEFVRGMIIERDLRLKLEKLYNYRRNGLHNQSEIPAFESEMRKERRQSNSYKDRVSRWSKFDPGANPQLFDIKHAPGLDLLSSNEQHLCSSLKLYPSQ